MSPRPVLVPTPLPFGPVPGPAGGHGPAARAPETDSLARLRRAARRARFCPMVRPWHDGPGGADGLVRMLPALLGRRAIFHAPGTAERSFDEAWLLACLAARAAGDRDSLAFLVGRRIEPSLRRIFHQRLNEGAQELAAPARETICPHSGRPEACCACDMKERTTE